MIHMLAPRNCSIAAELGMGSIVTAYVIGVVPRFWRF
jgi:hypothetical protein